MKATKELLKQMQPGDYVLVKTLGQLVDTGVVSGDIVSWVEDTKTADILGKMLPIDEVYICNDIPFVTINYNDEKYLLEEEMFFQLYPLTRGLI